ncbi:hypothetical protein BC937DRAFT_94981 [Endogone sp. FLAS-F59071]|nr:hypothetical protein BC937DRAFT_94981 [Endogone sp. FLAS-F59071]|eukprot:RUS20546.1 hypothetical protein BC937DRAFT_94981 [Endogone sp. FLAS-F59071]
MLPRQLASHLQRRDVDAFNNTVPVYTFTDDYEIDILHDLNVDLNVASIVAAVGVFTITLLMRLYDKKLVDRVSLRLSLSISITDFLQAIALELWAFSSDFNDTGCAGVTFLVVWLSNQYLFLSVAIAVNLQYLFLYKKPFNPALEKWYYIFAISLSLLSGAIPLAAGRFGADQAQQACWYKPSYTALSQKWEYGSYIIPNVFCIVYCLVVVLMVAAKLKQESRELDKQISCRTTSDNKEEKLDPTSIIRRKTRRAVNRVVRRIILYPIIPAVTQLGFIVSEVYLYLYKEPSFALNLWGVPTSAIPGLCNFIAFLIDPAVYNACECVKRDLIAKYAECPTPKNSDSTTLNQSATRTGFMPWFVRTFLISSKKSSDGSTFFMMSSNSHPVNKSSHMSQALKTKRQSRMHPGASEETVITIPSKAGSFSMKVFVETKVLDTSEDDQNQDEVAWADTEGRDLDMDNLNFHNDKWEDASNNAQRQMDKKEMQQAKGMMLGL